MDSVILHFIHSFIHFNSGSKAHKRPIKHTDNRQTDRQTRAKTQENIYKPKNYKQRIDRDKLHLRTVLLLLLLHCLHCTIIQLFGYLHSRKCAK